MIHNFTYIQQHLIEWSLQPYINIFGFFFYPLLFMVIGGYIYLKQQSVVAWAVGMLIFIVAFGNTFMEVSILVTFLQITVSLVFMGLMLVFITKIRR